MGIVCFSLVACVLGVVTSGGLVLERMAQGDLRVALLVNAVTTVAVLVVARWNAEIRARRPRAASDRKSRAVRVALGQGAGAAFAVALVHATLRLVHDPSLAWMNEGVAQLVNDAVAVGALLSVAWAASRRPPRLGHLAGALALVTAYRASAACWHLDRAPHGFAITIQQLVVAQFVAAALAVAAHLLVLSRRSA